jgi:methylthioribose-1-phosphate isomerase
MRTIAASWVNGHLEVLDQTKLPFIEATVALTRLPHYVKAIRTMQVRGAPLIGIVAAFGVAQEALLAKDFAPEVFHRRISKVINSLRATRPTAVNLYWALDKQREVLDAFGARPSTCARKLLETARVIQSAQVAAERKMAELALALLPSKCTVLTICNSGPLATGGIGTALGSIIHAYKHGRISEVFVPETRPRIQGSLTAWELEKAGVPFTIIVDGAVGLVLRTKNIGAAFVGADRIAANGDTANKIGTYAMAVLCREHHVPFIVVAPENTIDRNCPDGDHVVIEERDTDEIKVVGRRRQMPARWKAWNPAFDVTPNSYISFIVTEKGTQRYGRAI